MNTVGRGGWHISLLLVAEPISHCAFSSLHQRLPPSNTHFNQLGLHRKHVNTLTFSADRF